MRGARSRARALGLLLLALAGGPAWSQTDSATDAAAAGTALASEAPVLAVSAGASEAVPVAVAAGVAGPAAAPTLVAPATAYVWRPTAEEAAKAAAAAASGPPGSAPPAGPAATVVGSEVDGHFIMRGAAGAAGATDAAANAAPAAVGGPVVYNAFTPRAPPSWMFQKWPPTPPSAPTPPPAPPPRDLAFLAISDWGGQTDWPMTTDAQLQCAPVMASVATQLQVAHVVSAGDNFYDGGITGAANSRSAVGRFNTTWYQVYGGAHPELNVPWHVVAGNHDWEGNVSAQVAMNGSALFPSWNMPALYYTFTLPIPFSAQTVQFVMLDTETLTGGDAGQWDSAPTDVTQPPIDETQWSWLTDTLASSVSDWLIVVGHFPVYSAGENGPTPLLVSRLLPLMEAAGVALYICGHDHQLEHIGPVAGSAVDFLVVGAGAKFNASEAHEADLPAETLKFQYGIGCGFASVHVSRRGYEASMLTVTLWDGAGDILYSFTKPNPRAGYLPPAPPRPPAPPSVFNTKANREAVAFGALVMSFGLFVICFTVGRGVGAGPGGGGGSGPVLSVWTAPAGGKTGSGAALGGGRGVAAVAGWLASERASLLLQQRAAPQGSAVHATNRL